MKTKDKIFTGTKGLYPAEQFKVVDIKRTLISDKGEILFVAESPLNDELLFLTEEGECFCCIEYGYKGDLAYLSNLLGLC